MELLETIETRLVDLRSLSGYHQEAAEAWLGVQKVFVASENHDFSRPHVLQKPPPLPLGVREEMRIQLENHRRHLGHLRWLSLVSLRFIRFLELQIWRSDLSRMRAELSDPELTYEDLMLMVEVYARIFSPEDTIRDSTSWFNEIVISILFPIAALRDGINFSEGLGFKSHGRPYIAFPINEGAVFEWPILGNGGFDEMNLFFPLPVAPLGVTHRTLIADGQKMKPDAFLRHDRGHAHELLRRFARHPQFIGSLAHLIELYDEVLFRLELEILRRELLNSQENLSPSAREAVEALWFHIWHEHALGEFLWELEQDKRKQLQSDADSSRASISEERSRSRARILLARARDFGRRSVEGDLGARIAEDIHFAETWMENFLTKRFSPQ